MFSVHGAAPGVCIKEASSRAFAPAACLLLVLRWYQSTSGSRAAPTPLPRRSHAAPQLFPLSDRVNLLARQVWWRGLWEKNALL